MPLGDFPLTKLDALPDAMKKDAYQIWLWGLEGSAFDCPLEPLTQEFWKTHLESRLAYGLLLPAREHQKEEDLLVLISQKLTRAISRQYGRLPLRPRYQLFNFIMDIGLPNTEHLTSLHPFVRISNFKMFEEIFRSAILPIKDATGKYRRPTFAGTIDVLPHGLTPLLCPKCGQTRTLRENATLLNAYPVAEDKFEVRVLCVCDTCEQVFSFKTNVNLLRIV